MYVEKTNLEHFRKLILFLRGSEALVPYKFEIHIGTGLLFELADEIIDTVSSTSSYEIGSSLQIPKLTLSDLKLDFDLYGVKFVPDPRLGTDFEVRIRGGLTTVYTRGYDGIDKIY